MNHCPFIQYQICTYHFLDVHVFWVTLYDIKRKGLKQGGDQVPRMRGFNVSYVVARTDIRSFVNFVCPISSVGCTIAASGQVLQVNVGAIMIGGNMEMYVVRAISLFCLLVAYPGRKLRSIF